MRSMACRECSPAGLLDTGPGRRVQTPPVAATAQHSGVCRCVGIVSRVIEIKNQDQNRRFRNFSQNTTQCTDFQGFCQEPRPDARRRHQRAPEGQIGQETEAQGHIPPARTNAGTLARPARSAGPGHGRGHSRRRPGLPRPAPRPRTEAPPESPARPDAPGRPRQPPATGLAPTAGRQSLPGRRYGRSGRPTHPGRSPGPGQRPWVPHRRRETPWPGPHPGPARGSRRHGRPQQPGARQSLPPPTPPPQESGTWGVPTARKRSGSNAALPGPLHHLPAHPSFRCAPATSPDA